MSYGSMDEYALDMQLEGKMMKRMFLKIYRKRY